jgi:hypothetical protein
MSDVPQVVVLDSEGDGLAYDCTKLHILSYTTQEMSCEVCLGDGKTCEVCQGTGRKVKHLHSYEEMRGLLEQPNTVFACHNAVRHDMVAFSRILGIPMDYKQWVDTLALSWLFDPDRPKHGLDSYTQEAGVSKPTVEDWENVTKEQMEERCGNDVLLTWFVWKKFEAKLKELYA